MQRPSPPADDWWWAGRPVDAVRPHPRVWTLRRAVHVCGAPGQPRAPGLRAVRDVQTLVHHRGRGRPPRGHRRVRAPWRQAGDDGRGVRRQAGRGAPCRATAGKRGRAAPAACGAAARALHGAGCRWGRLGGRAVAVATWLGNCCLGRRRKPRGPCASRQAANWCAWEGPCHCCTRRQRQPLSRCRREHQQAWPVESGGTGFAAASAPRRRSSGRRRHPEALA